MAGGWSQAGGMARQKAAGLFWKAVPQNEWPEEPEYLANTQPVGDVRRYATRIGIYWSRAG